MKRVFAIIIVMVFLLTNMAACNSDAPNKDSKLNVFYADYDTNTVSFMAGYLKDHKASSGKSIAFGQEKQIETALAAGTKAEDMPDVLILPYNSLPKLSKYIEAGTFYDMNELIAKNSNFKLSDYNAKILDSGVYNGKRYIIPLNYSVNVLATTSEILEKNNISKDWSALSIKQLSDTAKEYKSKNPSGYILDMLSFYSFISNSDMAFIDMQSKKTDFDTAAFKNLADNYSELKQSVMPIDQLLKLTDEKQRSGLLKDEKTAMLTIPVTKISDLYRPYMSFSKEVEPVILPQPYGSDKVLIVARPQCFVAVNSKCADKKAAFELVRMLLGNEYQESKDAYGLPVNAKALDAIEKTALENENDRNSGCKSDNAVKSIISQLNKIISSIDKVDDVDFELSSGMQNIIDDASKGSKDLTGIANQLQSKAEEYFKQKVVVAGDGANANAAKSEAISIYYIDIDKNISNAITEFNGKVDNAKIYARVFNYTGYETFEEFAKALSTEVMAGVGPDLIVFDPGRDLNSINKVFASEAFTDLDELISEDSDFKIGDYNSRVINAGVYDGKRYFLPIDYSLPTFFTTEKILKNNNINIKGDSITFNEFKEVIDSFLNNKSKKCKYLFFPGMSLTNLITFSGEEFYSFYNKTSNFNSSDFKGLLRLYKKIQPVIFTQEAAKKYGSDFIKLLKNNILTMCMTVNSKAVGFMVYNSVIEHNMGEKMKVINIIDPNKSAYLGANITTAVAINNNCKNKKAAFEFVKILLSDVIQKDENLRYCPVKNEFLKEDIEQYSGEYVSRLIVGYDQNEAIQGIAMPALLSENLIKVHTNLAEVKVMDKSINIIINDAVKNYLEGKSDEDQTAKLINDKVTLFLNE